MNIIRKRMPPEHFFSEKSKGWDRIRTRLNLHRLILLLLDYDGTIVPIRKKPTLAVLSAKTRDILRHLAGQPNIFLGIVTGRSLQDIKSMVNLKNISYIANHGFQIVFDRKNWVHPAAQHSFPSMRKIFTALKNSLRYIPGVMVENKLLTLSVHYRNLTRTPVNHVKKIVERVVRSFPDSCRVTKGKKVIEIRPDVDWDKGYATIKMLKMIKFPSRPLVVYIGDDRTDEDVFRHLFNTTAITIRVGRNNRSSAKYYVKNTAEVKKLLKSIQNYSMIMNLEF
ncbi:MAG TPA: trehalose-phosphatase [Candidatus Thermoplasmatota archaeon]|nr:trehalose-phosphatase [Candidatus Thermoplasmatota archaeon]